MRAPQIIWCVLYALMLFRGAYQLGAGKQSPGEFVGLGIGVVLITMLVWWGGFFG